MKKLFFFLAVVGVVLFSMDSCKKTISLDELRAQELQKMDDFIAANGITVDPTESGMYYIPEVEGTGDSIKAGDRVKIFYTGMFLDSTIFDATGSYEPFEFTVGSTDVITGMSEGLTYMKQGGKATFNYSFEFSLWGC